MVGPVFSLTQSCLFVKNVNSFCFPQSTAGIMKVTTLLLLVLKPYKIISPSFNKWTLVPVHNAVVV